MPPVSTPRRALPPGRDSESKELVQSRAKARSAARVLPRVCSARVPASRPCALGGVRAAACVWACFSRNVLSAGQWRTHHTERRVNEECHGKWLEMKNGSYVCGVRQARVCVWGQVHWESGGEGCGAPLIGVANMAAGRCVQVCGR